MTQRPPRSFTADAAPAPRPMRPRLAPMLLVLLALLAPALPDARAATAQSAPAALPAQIVVVSDDNYPPYIFRDDEGVLKGVLVDQWKAWEQATGVRVVLRAMAWSQALAEMREGRANVIDTIFRTPEREQFYDFGTPYAKLTAPVYFHKSLGGLGGPADLRGFTVGVKAGDASAQELRSYGIHTLKEYASYKAVIEAAKVGDVKVFSVDGPPALYYLHKLGMEGDFRQAFVLSSGQFHRAVKKGDTALLQLVERGFAGIPKKTLTEIDERWLGAPLPGHSHLRELLLVLAVVGFVSLALGIFSMTLRRRVRTKTAELAATVEALRQSEARARTIFDSVNDLIFIHAWPGGDIVDVNQRTCDVLGYTREEVLALQVGDLSQGQPPYDQAHALAAMARAFEGERMVAEWLSRRKDGACFWVEVSIRRADVLGEARLLVSCRDISERKQAEGQLADKEALLQAMLRNLPFDFWARDLEQRVILQSHESMRAWGDLTGSGESASAPAREYGERWALSNRRALAGEVVSEEVAYRLPDGRERLFHAVVAPIKDGERVLGIMGINIDLTERKHLERRLAESELHFRTLANTGQALIWTSGTDMLCDSFNQVWLDFTGRSLEQELGNGWAEGVHPDDFDRCLKTYVEAFQRREPFSMEYRLRHTSGEYRWLLDQGTPRFDARGEFLGYIGHCLDITGQKTAEQELGEKRRVLQTILDTVPQAIFWKDKGSVYLGCNAALARYAGLGHPDGIIGRTDYDLAWSREETEAYRADDREIMDSRTPRLKYVEKQTQADGRVAWIETSKLPLLDDAGQAVGVMGIYEDITERIRAAELLEQSRLAATAANRAKSEFLANMSHEIRTPLNGVLGMIELLKHTGLGAEQTEFVQRADEAARRLLSLLNDVLDFSKIEAGRMVLSRNTFSLGEVFRTVSNVLEAQARAKGLEFQLVEDASVPPRLLGDDARLRQVLFNLAGNAVKFTAQGAVRVEAWRIPTPATPGRVRLCLLVSDTGVGISEDKVTYVFERFTQSDGSYARKYEGAGLGLAIVKRIVDLMGGAIVVDSEPGRGTDIYVAVDLELAPDLPARGGRRPSTDDAMPPLRLLLADDEPIGQLALKVQLERMGHSVTAVSNGLQVLEALERQDFDCVLMDIQMPELDGVEATRRIRSSASLGQRAKVPIVALTAYVMEGDRERFLAAGMDAHVGKPVQAEVLRGVLVALARVKR